MRKTRVNDATVRTEWFSAVPIKTIMDTFTEEKKSRPELVNPDLTNNASQTNKWTINSASKKYDTQKYESYNVTLS